MKNGTQESSSPGLENHDPQTPRIVRNMQRKNTAVHNPDADAGHHREGQDMNAGQPWAEAVDALEDGFHDALEMLAANSVTGEPCIC